MSHARIVSFLVTYTTATRRATHTLEAEWFPTLGTARQRIMQTAGVPEPHTVQVLEIEDPWGEKVSRSFFGEIKKL
jgi:hypothetical protein